MDGFINDRWLLEIFSFYGRLTCSTAIIYAKDIRLDRHTKHTAGLEYLKFKHIHTFCGLNITRGLNIWGWINFILQMFNINAVVFNQGSYWLNKTLLVCLALIMQYNAHWFNLVNMIKSRNGF